MGVSFKISVKGKRFRSKPCITRSRSTAVDDDELKDESRVLSKNESSLAPKLDSEETERSGDVNGVTGSSLHHLIPENGVSFTLNLFRDGYSIGKPSEIVPTHPNTLQDNSKLVLPYDRKSENLFSAIECGRLPGDILDDIPCKYVDGTIVCEECKEVIGHDLNVPLLQERKSSAMDKPLYGSLLESMERKKPKSIHGED